VARGTATLPDNLLKIGSDCVGEPAEDDNIHHGPRRIVGEGIVGEDVVGEYCVSGGCLPLEVGNGGLFFLQEEAGGLHMMTCSGNLGFSGVGVLDKSTEPLPKGLSLRVQRHGGEEAAAPTKGCSD
jgi:hypothetical protein